MFLQRTCSALLLIGTFALGEKSSCSDLGPNWHESGTTCLYTDWNAPERSYEETETFCQNMDSNIPSLEMISWKDLTNICATQDNTGLDCSHLKTFWLGKSFRQITKEDDTYMYYDSYGDYEEELRCFAYSIKIKTFRLIPCSRELEITICIRSVPNDTQPVAENRVSLNCPSAWQKFGEKCYLFRTDKKTNKQAENECKEINGSLVSIHSKDEIDFLTIHIGITYTDSWIGLRATPSNRNHIWLDGTPKDYTNWNRGEPSYITSYRNVDMFEGCVYIHSSFNLAGKWNDGICETKMGFICQTEAGNYENSDVARSCELEDFVPYRKGCYKMELEPKSFHEAELVCQKFGPNSHLTSVTDFYEQHFINSRFRNLTKKFWIGLSDTNKKNGHILRWTDDWPVYFSDLPVKELAAQRTGNNRCVAQSSKTKWEVTPCDSQLPFVCKLTNERPPQQKINTYKCPSGSNWIDVGASYCYYISTDTAYSWNNAQTACRSLKPSSYLVTFYSNHEEELLRPFILHIKNNIWIGLRRIDGAYKWDGYNESPYTHWSPEEPNGSGDECVEMYHHNMLWNDISCSRGANRFICATPKVKPTTTTLSATTTPATVNIPFVTNVPTTSSTSTTITTTTAAPSTTTTTAAATTTTTATTTTSGTSTTISTSVPVTTNSTTLFNTSITDDAAAKDKTPTFIKTTEVPVTAKDVTLFLQSTESSAQVTTITVLQNKTSLQKGVGPSVKPSLGAGTIATIVLLIVAAVLFAVAGTYFWNRRKRSRANGPDVSYDSLTRNADDNL